MDPIPIAASVMLIGDVAVSLRRTRARTQRGEIHQAREGDNPMVHGIDNIAAIELEVQPTLGTWTTRLSIGLTKRPSASQ